MTDLANSQGAEAKAAHAVVIFQGLVTDGFKLG